jgi:hypothetical protein
MSVFNTQHAMNILSHLQELDDLIIEHTKPPVTPILRRKLAFCIEQADAHSAAVERQEKTLATQIETIERLMKQNEDAIKKIASSEAWGEFEKEAAEGNKIIVKNSRLKPPR